MIVFQVLNFDPVKEIRNIENTMSHSYFNEESDYSQENCARGNTCKFCEIFKNTFFTE